MIAAFQEYEKAAAGRHEPGTLADQVVEVPAADEDERDFFGMKARQSAR
jgi:hypothetical protein